MKDGAFQLKLNTPRGSVVTIYRNPTPADYEAIREHFNNEFPDAAEDENFSRTAYEDENAYTWMSGAATHDMIVEQLFSLYGISAKQTTRSLIESQIYGMVNATLR